MKMLLALLAACSAISRFALTHATAAAIWGRGVMTGKSTSLRADFKSARMPSPLLAHPGLPNNRQARQRNVYPAEHRRCAQHGQEPSAR